jgi:predicted transcriptional regulator
MLNTSLKNIMTQGYFYVEDHESMGKALGVLRDRHISFLFVMKNDFPTGIITERKVMEKAVKGMDLLTSSVKDVMSAPLLALQPEDTITEACRFMSEHQIRHIGIVDGQGRLRGSVTPGNIVNMLSSDSFSSSAQVQDIMYKNIVLVQPESNLKDAGIEMLEKKSCCAIVMQEGTPAGLVSEKDAARALSYGQNIATIPLNKIMSTPVVTIKDTDSIAECIITLRHHRIHRAVVQDREEAVVGTIALNNMVQHIDIVLDKKLASRSF